MAKHQDCSVVLEMMELLKSQISLVKANSASDFSSPTPAHVERSLRSLWMPSCFVVMVLQAVNLTTVSFAASKMVDFQLIYLISILESTRVFISSIVVFRSSSSFELPLVAAHQLTSL